MRFGGLGKGKARERGGRGIGDCGAVGRGRGGPRSDEEQAAVGSEGIRVYAVYGRARHRGAWRESRQAVERFGEGRGGGKGRRGRGCTPTCCFDDITTPPVLAATSGYRPAYMRPPSIFAATAIPKCCWGPWTLCAHHTVSMSYAALCRSPSHCGLTTDD